MKVLRACLAAAVLSACDDPGIERAYVSSTGVIMRPYTPIPPGTAPRGTTAFRAALTQPGPIDAAAALERGREQYRVFCTPCHGARGTGDGVVVQRGHPAPPSYHIERLQAAEPAYIVQVITEGRGAMWPYAERIPPEDRWAIAHYVKALQRGEGPAPAGDPPAPAAGARP
jgi:mono/diheme cytochrome c family protein